MEFTAQGVRTRYKDCATGADTPHYGFVKVATLAFADEECQPVPKVASECVRNFIVKVPARPADEATRMDTLRALNILDTAPEERFDRLTRLAKRLFGVPMAVVSLVDANRQWFKSCTGLDASETSRDISFCGHAILGDDIFLIPDALLDERFSDNPLVVSAPHIRFYAGCPLTAANGSKLGTLCVLDREPRQFTGDDLALLRDLARMAEQELAAVQLATMDELSMLSNRRGFETLGQRALGLCQRLEKPAAMLFFDLDLFKQINDRFGHAEGDRALAEFSRLLKETFREADVLGRLGGDEFAVLATNVDERQLAQPLERLRQAVDAHNRNAPRGYDLLYSVGSVQFDASRHADIAALMADADSVMYEQKRNRKQARCADEILLDRQRAAA
jgi:diguanylate cyclase (GGDEF)-like protein